MISKSSVVFCCLLVTVLAVEKYSDKYDNINIKEILETERLRKAYIACLLDKGKCTPEGKELKEHMQDALETGCEKCTEIQLDGVYTAISYLIEHNLSAWNELAGKYDPERIWRKKYEDRAREKGIVIPED